MKCINKKWKIFICITLAAMCLSGCVTSKELVASYEMEHYNKNLYQDHFFSESLCVSAEDVALENANTDTNIHASALFDLNQKKVLQASNMHEKIYPASTTKILTAYVALKYGKLEDTIKISKAAVDFQVGESTCGLKEGDTWSLKDLLYGLMMESGNDAAVAISELISGSEDEFMKLANQEAKELGATHTHYTNPHGLHEEDHYTTAYDLYLMFQAAIKNEVFLEIIQASTYKVSIVGADTSTRELVFEPTNLYAKGEADKPTNVTLIGGKTGTTTQARYCLVLLEKDEQDNNYISIVMGAETKPILYVDMTALIQAIPST
ncbi:MAG: serine hydrolase [Lachnospiraceae bacterium]